MCSDLCRRLQQTARRIALAALAGLGPGVAAQESRWSVSAEWAYVAPDVPGDVVGSGHAGALRLARAIGERLQLTAEGGYYRLPTEPIDPLEIEAGHWRLVGGAIGLEYSLNPGHKATVYGRFGVGVFGAKATVGPLSNSETGLRLNGGLGVAYALGRTEIFVQVMVERFFLFGDFSAVPTSVGVRLRL